MTGSRANLIRQCFTRAMQSTVPRVSFIRTSATKTGLLVVYATTLKFLGQWVRRELTWSKHGSPSPFNDQPHPVGNLTSPMFSTGFIGAAMHMGMSFQTALHLFRTRQDPAGPVRHTRMEIERGKVRLSDRMIFGLLAVAILSSANQDQADRKLDGYYLSFGSSAKLTVNEWWGRANEFAAIAAQDPTPVVKLDFGNWVS
jgi:hypothetical protein